MTTVSTMHGLLKHPVHFQIVVSIYLKCHEAKLPNCYDVQYKAIKSRFNSPQFFTCMKLFIEHVAAWVDAFNSELIQLNEVGN